MSKQTGISDSEEEATSNVLENSFKKSSNKKKASFRKISTDKYVIAGVLTLLIFSLGLCMGVILEEERYNWAEEINQEQDVEYLSLQLQYLFLTNLPNSDGNSSINSCAVLTTSLQESVNDLSDSLAKIVEYEEANSLPDEEFVLLKRRYTLDNIRYWLLTKQATDKCQMDFVTILYFYNEDCKDCPSQGTVLSYYKAILEDGLLVFPIDQDLSIEEPLVKILLSLYNIDVNPSIVINDEIHSGFVDKENLKILLCDHQDDLSICVE
ncbi:hypothetical protein CL619_04645 [archaeon]|nr:hypothetical protein [archaeon]|tara:strand:+ start:176 stop:976 length:801 start_codon:yes stop_codon:yes gene_type:complete